MDITDRYGYIEVNKKSDDGTNLAGAKFKAINDSTDEVFYIGPTNSNGYAISGQLPFGSYTVKETVFPEGYTKGSKDTWEVTVSSNNNGFVTIDAVNNKETGTFKVVINSEDNYVS